MKRIVLFVCVSFCMVFSHEAMQAQISKKYKAPTNVNLSNAKKLPMLKATKNKGVIDASTYDFSKTRNPITVLSEIPKPVAKASGVVSATFDANSMKTRDATLRFYGLYDGKTLSIANMRRRSNEKIVLDFNALKGKTYRITLKFTASFDSSKYGALVTDVQLNGAVYKATFKIDEGENTIDFLTQSTYTGNQSIFMLSYAGLRSKGDYMEGNYDFKIKEVKVRQLED